MARDCLVQTLLSLAVPLVRVGAGRVSDTHGPSGSVPLVRPARHLCAPGLPFLVQQRVVRQGYLSWAYCGANALVLRSTVRP